MENVRGVAEFKDEGEKGRKKHRRRSMGDLKLKAGSLANWCGSDG